VKSLVKLIFCLALFFVPIQFGFSRGDKLIPQIVDGPGWATKFDITNVSTAANIVGTMRLAFYHNNGTLWTLQTTLGTGSSFTLSIGARQTLHVETQGATPSIAAGYAVIYDEETTNSEYSEDFVLGISVYYVVLNGTSVVDTVTVTVPQPTALAKFPVEIDNVKNINSGLAVANLSGATNAIKIDLFRHDWVGVAPDYLPDYSVSFNLASGEQQGMYLDNSALFPNLKSFKGMAEITADGPIALLGLLSTVASDGTARYATLVPVDMESLRRNSYLAVLQAETNANPFMPLDLDNMVSDFYRVAGNPDGYSWDLAYQYGTTSNPADTTTRYLKAYNGAAIVSLGTYDSAAFDAISLSTLKGLTYTAGNSIDLSGSNLFLRRTFAVHTDLGNYAKMRIFRIIDTTASDGIRPLQDLVLEVVVYK
jgi:hypothetical protein